MKHPFQPILSGHGTSDGISIGPIFILPSSEGKGAAEIHQFSGVTEEITRLKAALSKLVAHLQKLAEKTRVQVGDEEAAIFEAHQMMVQDEEFIDKIQELIRTKKQFAEAAIQEVFEEQILIFSQSDSDYMKERALDLRDLRSQLIRMLQNDSSEESELISPAIVIGNELTPSQLMAMDRNLILGLVIETGGVNSHTSILARTLGIPMIVGVQGACKRLANEHGTGLAIDGSLGTIYSLDQATRQYFEMKVKEQMERENENERWRGKLTKTADGVPLSLYANIGSPSDAKTALQADSEGVGLFRSEFLYMDREQAPSLEEQCEAYAEVLTAFAPNEVIIRTLDVGGDKPISYLAFPHEENPFLGIRAIRYCLEHIDFFKTQIKALLLANQKGNLSIMFPMVSRASEAKVLKELVETCHQELRSHPQYRANAYRLGAMVEIPALIFELKELSQYVSFISVGTNDLLQYAVAVDRAHSSLQALYSPYHLGFLRMMEHLAKEGARAGLELGICGELAGQEEFSPLWVAMGYRKLSMSPHQVLGMRAKISRFTLKDCQKLLKAVNECRDETEVKSLLGSS